MEFEAGLTAITRLKVFFFFHLENRLIHFRVEHGSLALECGSVLFCLFNKKRHKLYGMIDYWQAIILWQILFGPFAGSFSISSYPILFFSNVQMKIIEMK